MKMRVTASGFHGEREVAVEIEAREDWNDLYEHVFLADRTAGEFFDQFTSPCAGGDCSCGGYNIPAELPSGAGLEGNELIVMRSPGVVFDD